MGAAKLAAWLGIVAGFVGTILLYKGSFAFQSFSAYMGEEMVKEIGRANRRRLILQRAGIALLGVSFVAQGVSLSLG